MKIEVEVPDLQTLVDFMRAKPPEGVTVSEHTVALHGDGAAGFSRIVIEFGVLVAAGVVVDLIRLGLAKYLKEHPNYKPNVYYRERRLEHTEIFRVIEEVRTTEHKEEQKDASK